MILSQVYTGTVISVAEYATTSWDHESGFIKTRPLREIEKTADVEPLEKTVRVQDHCTGRKVKQAARKNKTTDSKDSP